MPKPQLMAFATTLGEGRSVRRARLMKFRRFGVRGIGWRTPSADERMQAIESGRPATWALAGCRQLLLLRRGPRPHTGFSPVPTFFSPVSALSYCITTRIVGGLPGQILIILAQDQSCPSLRSVTIAT